jgi:hypothetical protein
MVITWHTGTKQYSLYLPTPRSKFLALNLAPTPQAESTNATICDEESEEFDNQLMFDWANYV